MIGRLFLSAAAACIGLAVPGFADEAAVTVHAVTTDGIGDPVGELSFSDTEFGLLIEPSIEGIEPGLHGMHVHQNPDCGPREHEGKIVAAGAAGDHIDPAGTGTHAGPYGDGHLGDLPNLVVEDDGTATLPVLAPRVTVADLEGRALVLHAGPDRYDDEHSGGDRAYCGVIE